MQISRNNVLKKHKNSLSENIKYLIRRLGTQAVHFKQIRRFIVRWLRNLSTYVKVSIFNPHNFIPQNR